MLRKLEIKEDVSAYELKMILIQYLNGKEIDDTKIPEHTKAKHFKEVKTITP